MSQLVRLESFLRAAPPPPPPAFDADDLAAAWAAGHDEGLAKGRDAAAQVLAAAVETLAVTLAEDQLRQADLAHQLDASLGEVAQAIIAALAAPLRAEALAARVCTALHAEIAAGAPVPPRLRCEAASAPVLRAALDAGGLVGIVIDIGGTGAEFGVSDGLMRLDPDRVQAALQAIVAEIGASATPVAPALPAPESAGSGGRPMTAQTPLEDTCDE